MLSPSRPLPFHRNPQKSSRSGAVHDLFLWVVPLMSIAIQPLPAYVGVTKAGVCPMPLTLKQVQNAKPGRHSDGRGLYLLVKPSGARSWVLRVQYQGQRFDWGIGSVAFEPIASDLPIHLGSTLTLGEAREKARIGRELA